MEYFIQQLVNGLTLGSIYGLIAIGYTMVYGIIGMINFAHGDIFMLGAFMAMIVFLILRGAVRLGPRRVLPARHDARRDAARPACGTGRSRRVAYRPLRGSFRLAPLITAIGMSIFLSNFVQVTQGPRNKPIGSLIPQTYNIRHGHRSR